MSAAQTAITEVRNDQSGQTVVLPDEFRFSQDHVYVSRDPETGVVSISERPFPSQESSPRPRPSLEDVFKMFDDLGADDFDLERDLSPPVDKDLF